MIFQLMADFVGDVLFEKGNNSLDRMISEVGKKNKPQFIQSIIDLIQWIRERINGNKELTYQVLKLESKYKRLLSEAQAATKVNTESNTDGGSKFSFAGEKPLTANKSLLESAKERIENGEDSETVRQRGMIWTPEICDLKNIPFTCLNWENFSGGVFFKNSSHIFGIHFPK